MPLQTCTKRTPRSISRRAVRQLRPKSAVAGSSVPYSVVRSAAARATGRELRARSAASSRPVRRRRCGASSRESPGFCSGVVAVEFGEKVQAVSVSLWAVICFAECRWSQIGDRHRGGRLDDRRPGERPAGSRCEKLPALLYGRPRGSGSTTKVGRLSDKLTQAIADPRPHAGEARQQEAGVHHVAGGAVDVRLRRHRHQEGQVIDAPATCGKTLLTQRPHWPCCWNANGRFHDRAGHAGRRRPGCRNRLSRRAVCPARACSRTCPSG